MEMLEWLVTHPSAQRETACFVLMAMDLESRTYFPRLAEALSTFLNRNDADNAAIMVAGRVLQSSLRTSTPESADLAAIVFDIVYHAAAASRLSDDTWRGLLPFLPSSSWWQDWDRCERLRKGVAEKFRSEQWPARRLVGITKDDNVFAEIIGELRYWYSGRRVLAAAAESMDANPRRACMPRE